MRISQERIDEFKQIYYRQFGKELSDEEAFELGLEVLHFLRVIYKPLPKDHRCDACGSSTK